MKTFVDAIKKVYNVTDVDGILMTNVEQTWGYISSGNYTETCKEFLGGLGMVDWAHDAIDVSPSLGKMTVPLEFVLSDWEA